MSGAGREGGSGWVTSLCGVFIMLRFFMKQKEDPEISWKVCICAVAAGVI